MQAQNEDHFVVSEGMYQKVNILRDNKFKYLKKHFQTYVCLILTLKDSRVAFKIRLSLKVY